MLTDAGTLVVCSARRRTAQRDSRDQKQNLTAEYAESAEERRKTKAWISSGARAVASRQGFED